ncbi:hypothetical protein SpCBS45565_g05268 [Spizellomyces sp. 'palustris']|nr:hypothetical protein SpCBS45565_g05268 [Spizellomyces sp. 'palustris']
MLKQMTKARVLLCGALRIGQISHQHGVRTFHSTIASKIKVDRKDTHIEIQWGPSASPSCSKFNYSWLRDNCQCPLCLHPSNRQKLHSSGDVALSIKPESISIVEGGNGPHLEIKWPSGSLRPHANHRSRSAAHTSVVDVAWLQKQDYSPQAVRQRRNALFKPVYWDGSIYDQRKRSVEYQHFISSDDGLRKALEELRDYGLCFIRNAPTKDKEVENIGRRFGCIRETFYGTSWDVKSVPDAKNIAYTSLDLGLHMDLMYFEAPPGLQFLYCLKNSVTGGESIFLDSFKAVDILKTMYPEEYNVLTQVPVTFHYINDGHHMHFRRPTIVEDDLNEQRMVYYAPPFQGPLEAEEHLVEPFYKAFAKFEEILRDPKLTYRMLLQPGDCVIFANRRVLHGRAEFDAASGDRHLKGAYVDWDDFKDKLRVLDVRK